MYLNPRIYDNGLSALTNEVDKLFICSQEPTNFAQASSTYALGVKNGPTISAPQDRTPSGRKVVLAAVESGSPGSVTASGTATHYALVDSVNSRLLATAPIGASQVVSNGNTWTSGSVDIGIIPPS